MHSSVRTGCGKTTTGSALAVRTIAEGTADRILLVAYTNAAVNEFGTSRKSDKGFPFL